MNKTSFCSIIRRLSAQSERTSFSDVDSPISHHPVIENILSKTEIPTPEVLTPVESTSPLLSSLLKSPTTSTLIAPPTILNPPISTVEDNVVEEKVVIEEEMEVDNDVEAVDIKLTEPVPELQVEIESAENVSESNEVVENGTAEPEMAVEIAVDSNTVDNDVVDNVVDVVDNKDENEEQIETKIEENLIDDKAPIVDVSETLVEKLIENESAEILVEKVAEPEVDENLIDEPSVTSELSDVAAVAVVAVVADTNEQIDEPPPLRETPSPRIEPTATITPNDETPSNGLSEIDEKIIIKTEETDEDHNTAVVENTEAPESVPDIKDQNQDNSDLAEIKVENVFEEETKITATTTPSEDLDEDKPLTSRYVLQLEWPSEYQLPKYKIHLITKQSAVHFSVDFDSL